MGPEPPVQKSSKLVVTSARTGFFRHLCISRVFWGPTSLWSPCVALPCRERERLNPPHHPEQPSGQMALRQEEPVAARMFYQPTACLHQPLLQTRQGPVPDPLWQCQPSPEIPQVVCNHAQPKPYLVAPEPMTTEARHLHRLLAFFDPLFGCAALIQVAIGPRSEVLNSLNGQCGAITYASEKLTSGTVNVCLSAHGDYVLAFSYTFSIVSEKIVAANMQLVF